MLQITLDVLQIDLSMLVPTSYHVVHNYILNSIIKKVCTIFFIRSGDKQTARRRNREATQLVDETL